MPHSLESLAGTLRRRSGDVALWTAMGIVLAPMLAFSVAVSIDLTAWTFTGHELFPWIGKALNG